MGVLSSPQTEKEVSCEKEPTSNEIKEDKHDKVVSKLSGDLTAADGWEMHEDEGGLYFWHVKSGTIQREIPQAFQNTTPMQQPVARLSKSSTSSNISKSVQQQSCASSSSSGADNVEQKRKSLPPSTSSSSSQIGNAHIFTHVFSTYSHTVKQMNPLACKSGSSLWVLSN